MMSKHHHCRYHNGKISSNIPGSACQIRITTEIKLTGPWIMTNQSITFHKDLINNPANIQTCRRKKHPWWTYAVPAVVYLPVLSTYDIFVFISIVNAVLRDFCLSKSTYINMSLIVN